MPWLGRLLVLITFLGSTWGVLLVGSKFVRSNEKYMVVISNFYASLNQVNLLLQMEGVGDGEKKIFSIKRTVEVRRYMNRIVNFNIPTITSSATIKLTINGLGSFNFYQEQELEFRNKSISGLIQINKPIFKPGDTMKFRTIVLDHELKPPANVTSVTVTVWDTYGTSIRTWAQAKLYAGVFENHVQIPASPIFGTWNISVLVEGKPLVSKSFEVKEYVLVPFDVQVTPTVTPLEEHQALSLMITANYHFGRPVKGEAKVELYLEDDKLDQVKKINMNGMGKLELNFAETLELYQDNQNVSVKVTFVEQHSNRAVVKAQRITVYKYPYRAELFKKCLHFRPGYPFLCTLKLMYHDGSPVSKVPFTVKIDEHGEIQEQTHITQLNGEIKLKIIPKSSTETINIRVTGQDSSFTFVDHISKARLVSRTYMKVELKSPIKLGLKVRLMVTCNEPMTFIIYYVIAKGNILDAAFLRPNRLIKYMFQIDALEKMVPKATIIVATVSNSVVIWDSLDIDYKQFGNRLDISTDETKVKPGYEIELMLNGPPEAYVALAAYDKSLLQFSKHHDLFWDDAIEVFNDFHEIEPKDSDLFYKSLFARILGGHTLDINHKPAGPSGMNHIKPEPAVDSDMDNIDPEPTRKGSLAVRKNLGFRKNFQEAWLWKNVSLQKSGSIKLSEVVPDTTTSWYLTGFSIDAEYGLDIIKMPIEFTTVKPFYIVDSLPYSIKRGEVAVLLFTLFSDLGEEYTADVTLFSVANQMEFVGRSADNTSYTKTVSIPSKSGTPVSFMVKARKLGGLVVRVKAVTMTGVETDALEKVIWVIPENAILNDTYSRETPWYRKS